MELETSEVPIDLVSATLERLNTRPTRPPDHARENCALLALADEMAGRPDNVLDLLCELILETCDAESAGVSLLNEETDEFYWPAVAGAWAPFVGGTMPRSASPCGEVVKRDSVLIFRDVVEQFPAAAQASPEIAEILLAPFHQDGKPIGTVWAISHDPEFHFDAEHRRLLCSMARFAAAAYQTTRAHQSANVVKKQLALANRELGHRLKNLLTMAMAIVGQTLKDAHDQDSIEVLQQRLQALASAHNVLIEQASDCAELKAVAKDVLGTIGQLERVTFDGPDVTLGPRTTLALSLIIHELGTNALKYGALSKEDGRVAFVWNVTAGEGEPQLIVEWREIDGPRIAKPERSGFGSRLINMGLLGQGGTELDYAPDGLKARFSAPFEAAQSF